MRLYLAMIMAVLAFPAISRAQNIDMTAPVGSVEEANRILNVAHAAFIRGEHESACDIYLKVAESGYGSAAVWFNAGTAAYRNGERGKAVLYMRRALRIDPSYDRALKSLELISPETNSVDSGFLAQVVQTVFRRTSPGFWVLLAEGAFLLFCLGVALAMKSADRDRRGHWIAVLGWSAVFAVAFGGLAAANHNFRVGGQEAVVIEDKTITRAAPEDSSTAQLELPAGTIVNLVEEPRRGFVRVKMADGRSGYVATSKVERI